MLDKQGIDHIAERLASLLPPGLDEARGDLAANFRDVLTQALRRQGLVTREEFDVQAGVLAHTREQLTALEAQVTALEAALSARER